MGQPPKEKPNTAGGDVNLIGRVREIWKAIKRPPDQGIQPQHEANEEDASKRQTMSSGPDSSLKVILSDCVVDEDLAQEIRYSTQLLELPAGYVLFREGDACKDVFYVVRGEVTCG